ncbi:MAG: GNAT family N-acetyltransferase [Bacteroidota bacterium]
MKSTVDISLLSPKSLRGENDLHRLTQLINEAYALTEGPMFRENYVRTNAGEIEKKFEKHTLLGAWVKEVIVGGVYVEKLTDGISTFGMLAVDPAYMGLGIGKQLVQAAEERSLELGCSHMKIEIVRSHKISMPHKDVLHAWYQRMGYEFLGESSIESIYPNIIPDIIHEGVIQLFQKSLTVPKTP